MTAVIIAFLVSLVAAECTEVSPFLAKRLVRWAAVRWSSDAEIAAAYADEWLAVIDDRRPGKLLKLVTALAFTGGAIGRAVPRRLFPVRRKLRSLLRAIARKKEPQPRHTWIEIEALQLTFDDPDSALVMRAIGELLPDERTTLMLRVVKGLHAEQVAAITGHRVGKVRALMRRGLNRLSRKLEKSSRQRRPDDD
jgi:hypothetical protein